MADVLIAPHHLHRLPGPHLDALAAAGLTWDFPPVEHQMTAPEVLNAVGGYRYVLAGSEPYPRQVFEARPQLRVLARAGVGYDAIDVRAATEHGVVVAFAPGSNQDAVGEHAMLLILALAKGLFEQDRRIRAGEWPRYPRLPLRGRTLGVVGLGRTGKALARRAAGFDMTIVAHDIAPDHEFAKSLNVEMLSLEQVLRRADFVSLHVPLTDQTRRFINAETLALMRPSAFLVNAARGGVVDEEALAAALRDGRLAGAGIDVFAQEPPGGGHPLCELGSVILSAHTAGVDLQSRQNMALFAAEAIAEIHRGGWPAERIVNPEVRPVPSQSVWGRATEGVHSLGQRSVEFKKGVRGLEQEEGQADSEAKPAAPPSPQERASKPIPRLGPMRKEGARTRARRESFEDDIETDMPRMVVSRDAQEAIPETSQKVSVAPLEEAAPDEKRRRAAARWYRRMNPGHNFQLSVLFTGSRVEVIATEELPVSVSAKDIVVSQEDPFVNVEPCFPGCIVSPPVRAVDLSADRTTAKFWITPLVEGDLDEACVLISRYGRPLEALPTPAKVVKRTAAKVCLAAGLIWPGFQQVSEWAGWHFEVPLLRLLTTTGGAVGFGVALLMAAAFFWRITRPVETNQDAVPLTVD